MSDTQEHTPAPPEPQNTAQHADGGIEGQQAATKSDAAIASFAQKPDEHLSKLQDRFIGELLEPVIGWVILPDARALIADIATGIRQGLPDAIHAREWGVRAATIVERSSRLFADLQRAASRTLGHIGAFAMAEIAHHCPKFMHMVIAPTCQALADALERGDAEAAETNRGILLAEIGGEGARSPQARLDFLLEKYFVTPHAFRRRFRDATEGITAPGNITRIMGRLEVRMQEIMRDVLKTEQHAYDMEFVTNIPEEQQTEDVIPRAGLVEEALAELMTNALKVMEDAKQGATLTVSVILRKDGSVLLKVRDDGPGIGDRDPEELFEKGRTTTQRFGGTGMGLTFLRQNIQEHFQGFLTAQKNENTDGATGITVSCILPPSDGWPQDEDA